MVIIKKQKSKIKNVKKHFTEQKSFVLFYHKHDNVSTFFFFCESTGSFHSGCFVFN